MVPLHNRILEFLASFILGSFGALVRLIVLNPEKLSLFRILIEMIVGAFVGSLTWIFLNNFTQYSPLTICGWAGVFGIISKEFIKVIVILAKKEAFNKYGVKLKK